MALHKNMGIFFFVLFVSQFYPLSTADYPVQSFDGQQDIVIQPSSVVPRGEIFKQGFIHPNATVKIILDFKNVENASFVIFQAHSYIQPLILSSSIPLKAGNYVNGTDIGLYTKLPPLPQTVMYFISNPNTVKVNLLLVPVFYSSEDPVPGGCNLSFPVDIAPFMNLSYDYENNIAQVEAQAASVQDHSNCTPNGLSYEVYEVYPSNSSADGYFDAILSVITAEKAEFKGIPSLKPTHSPELRRWFGSYPGFGSIYVVTVRNVKTGRSSAYVPISNFNCIDGNDEHCNNYGYFVWLTGIVSLLFIISECFYIAGKDTETFTRSILIFVSVFSLSTLTDLTAQVLIFISAMSMPVTCLNREAVHGREWGLPNCIFFMVDQTFAVVPAHIFYGILVFVFQVLFPSFQGWITAMSAFLALILMFYILIQWFQRPWWLEINCSVFILLSFISVAFHAGALIFALKDPSRILICGLPDVTFFYPISRFDNIAIVCWPAIGLTYYSVRKFLRAQFAPPQYVVIINESPLSSSRSTYNSM